MISGINLGYLGADLSILRCKKHFWHVWGSFTPKNCFFVANLGAVTNLGDIKRPGSMQLRGLPPWAVFKEAVGMFTT
jgi:hypothetical protein